MLRDRGYRWLVASNFCYALASDDLNIAMPVYFVECSACPAGCSATVFVINTLMIGVGQGLVVRPDDRAPCGRGSSLLGLVSAASFLVLWARGPRGRSRRVVVVLLGAVVYTLGELVGRPGLAALAAERRRRRCAGATCATYQLVLERRDRRRPAALRVAARTSAASPRGSAWRRSRWRSRR